jgi:hypothetical protein
MPLFHRFLKNKILRREVVDTFTKIIYFISILLSDVLCRKLDEQIKQTNVKISSNEISYSAF